MIFDKENKQVLVKGEFTTKLLEEVFNDLFNKPQPKSRWENMDWTPVHHVWEDEDGKHSSWKIGPMYTNDAGYEQFNKAIKEEMEREIEKDRRYLWGMILSDDNGVSSVTSIAMKEFNEVGRYTKEEIEKLEEIRNSLPTPEFSQDPFIAHEQLNDYVDSIKNKLNG